MTLYRNRTSEIKTNIGKVNIHENWLRPWTILSCKAEVKLWQHWSTKSRNEVNGVELFEGACTEKRQMCSFKVDSNILKMHSSVSGNYHCEKTKRIQSENVNGEGKNGIIKYIWFIQRIQESRNKEKNKQTNGKYRPSVGGTKNFRADQRKIYKHKMAEADNLHWAMLWQVCMGACPLQLTRGWGARKKDRKYNQDARGTYLF